MSEEQETSSKEEGCNDIQEIPQGPSNERLLCTAFISFISFAIAQTVAAVYAGSEAMLGDSAAMGVDALTYLFNWYAERQKQVYADRLKSKEKNVKSMLQYRKYSYQLELVPPLLSVTTLLIVTGFVLKKAVHILILDTRRDRSKQANPNTHLMMLFSFLNLLLDGLNVFCFARAKHALGYTTNNDDDNDDTNGLEDEEYVQDMQSLLGEDELEKHSCADDPKNSNGNSSEVKKLEMEPLEIEGGPISNDLSDEDTANLNMCSAYTHVFADTLRSIAVIIASLLAEFLPAVTPEEADASAAVIVSILIVLSLIPLVGGMMHTFKALKRVNEQLQEEETEGIEFDEDEEEGSWT